MARLPRVLQKIFGSTAASEQISQFGSLKAGTPTFTTNLSTIQALQNYTDGWFQGVIGSNSPAIEDMNSLFYLTTAQLAYVMQAGIPEYSSLTTYYTGNLATVPVVVFTITSGSATAGATYTNSGQTFTVQSTIASDTLLTCTYTGLPVSSGTLTKASGTGDTTITFSAYIVSNGLWVSTTDDNTGNAVTDTTKWRPYIPSLGKPNYPLKVNSAGTGTEFALLGDAGISDLSSLKLTTTIGSWLPVIITSGTYNVSFSTQTGNYVQIGKAVYFNADIQWTVTSSTANGTFAVSLPIMAAATGTAATITVFPSRITLAANYTWMSGTINASSPGVLLVGQGSGQAGQTDIVSTNTSTGVTRRIAVSGCYFVD